MDRPPTPVTAQEPVDFDSILPPSQVTVPLERVGFIPFSGLGHRLGNWRT